MYCVNCGAELKGKYCEECGQPAHPTRIKLRDLWNDFMGRFLSLDTKYLRTIKDLTLRPGVVSKEFVNGNRVRYIPPVSYFVIMLAILFLLLPVLGMSFSEMLNATQEDLELAGEVTESQRKIQIWFNEKYEEYMRTFLFLQVPFLALWGKILWRKSRRNFLEHSIVAFYSIGHLLWLTILTVAFYRFTESAFVLVSSIVSPLYFAWACTGFYERRSFGAFLKGIANQLLGQITYVFFLVVGILVGFFIYIKWINPDFVNSI